GFLQRRARDYGDPLSLTFFASCPGNGRFIQCRRSGRGAGQRTDPVGQRPRYILHGSGDAEKKAVLSVLRSKAHEDLSSSSFKEHSLGRANQAAFFSSKGS